MKKLFVMALTLCILLVLAGCGENITCENCEVDSVYDTYVYLSPKCPECGHLNPSIEVDCEKGGKFATFMFCEECGGDISLSIQR